MPDPATTMQPDWLAALPIWLQHRDKVPHYSGLRAPKLRSGDLDTPDDRKRLVALPDLRLGQGFEPGYALGPVGDKVLCGVDLDKCFGHDGKVVEPLKKFYTTAKDAGAMVEISRSGHGLHIVWLAMPDHLPPTFKRPGIECYTGRRFFAWGTKVHLPGAPTPIDMRPAFAHLPIPESTTPEQRGRRRIQEGGRDNYLWERRVQLQAAGAPEDTMLDVLRAINDEDCDPPLPDNDVQRIARGGGSKAEPRRTAVEVFAPVEAAALWTATPTKARLGQRPARVEFVVDGWMQRGKVGLIASEGGTGKTTMLVHMGVAIVLGREWMGRIVRQGPFMLLSRDDDQDDLDAVVQEVCLALKLSDDEQVLVERDLYVISLRSHPQFKLIAENGRSWHASAFVPELMKEVERIRPVALAIDTVRQFSGVESTDEGAQIVFMSVAAQIAALGPSVIVAHHVGKQAAREKIVDMYSAIGSSALSDNARFMWRLLKIDPADKDVVLPFDMALPSGAELLQLISTRGSLRVKKPQDIWYTRNEFALEVVVGNVTKLSKEEVKRRVNDGKRAEQLQHLIDCFKALGVVGRKRARVYFDERGWVMDNNTFSDLKTEAEEAILLE